MILLRALALAAVSFIPGRLAVSFVRQASDGLKGEERTWLSFVTGTGLVALCAQVLAMASAYSLGSLLLCVGALSLLLALAARLLSLPLRWSGLKRSEWKRYAATVLLLVAVFAILSPPGRIVFGYIDVGVYPNIAAQIERDGGVYAEVGTVRQVDAERRYMVYDSSHDPELPYEAAENKAFYITDFERGRVVPQFFYLWPSCMAVFASFLGLESMFWAVTFMGVLALWGLYLLAVRLLGWRWGVAAAVMVAVSPLMLYFSRYCTSEMMNMVFFLGGSLCLTAYLRQESGGRVSTAVAAAGLFTLGFLCHVDFIMVAVPLALFYLARRIWSGLDRADWWFCGMLVAGAALSLLVGGLSSTPYFHSIWGSPLRRRMWMVGFPAVLLPLIYAAAFSYAAAFRDRVRRLARFRRTWTALLWAGFAAAFIFIYFIRSQGGSAVINYGPINPLRGPSYMNQALVRWAWYFSFVGTALIYAGYAAWFTRSRDYAASAVAVTGAFFTLVYSLNLHCTPIHMYTMRRLVPVVLPTAFMAIAFFLKALVDMAHRVSARRAWAAWAGKAAAAALLLYLMFFMVNAALPSIGLQEGGNQLELVGEVAERVEEGGVVVMDYHLGDLFGAPLRCFYGVESVWILDNAYLAQEDFVALLGDLGFPARRAYLLWRPAMSGGQARLSAGLRQGVGWSFWLRENDLEKTFDRRPAMRTHHLEEMVLYRLEE